MNKTPDWIKLDPESRVRVIRWALVVGGVLALLVIVLGVLSMGLGIAESCSAGTRDSGCTRTYHWDWPF